MDEVTSETASMDYYDPSLRSGTLTPAARLQAVMRELDLISREVGLSQATASPITNDDRSDDDLRRFARGLLWERAIFSELLGSDEFVDPASNIMLFLYGAGVDVTPSAGDCCEAAGVPRTTALRRIGILEHKRFVIATCDPADGRRTFVTLTDHGRTTMRRCLVAVSKSPDGGLLAVSSSLK